MCMCKYIYIYSIQGDGRPAQVAVRLEQGNQILILVIGIMLLIRIITVIC